MKKSILIAIALTPALSLAAPYTIGEVSYGGNGCPADTVQYEVTHTGSNTALTFALSEFGVETTEHNNLDRKSCGIAIPVQVAPGYSVALDPPNVNGYVDLPEADGFARFEAEFFVAGKRGLKHFQLFRNSGSISDVNNGMENQLAWSECGKSTILRANFSLSVQSNSQETAAYGEILNFGTAERPLRIVYKACGEL